MTISRRIGPLVRRSVRYLLVSRGFMILEGGGVLASLSVVLTGSRIAAIDRLGNRADIVASIVVTALTIVLLRAVNRRAMVAIDRHFFRESYNAQLILMELRNAVRSFSRIEQLVEVAATMMRDALHPVNVTVFLEEVTNGDLISALSLGNPTRARRRDRPLPTLMLPRDGWAAERMGRPPGSNTIEIQRADELIYSPTNAAFKAHHHEFSVLRRIRSVLLVPIESNGHLFGIISLGRRLGDLAYSNEDKKILLIVAAQMATLIENLTLIARLAEEQSIKRELEFAAEVQRRMFPAGGLEDATLEVYGTCIPARGVGGDYYDYFETEDRQIGIAIADVAGKGIGAALLMSTVQAMLRSQLISGVTRLTDLVSTMSRLLHPSTGDSCYASFFFCEFDRETRSLTYVNAGHNPPMVVRGVAAYTTDGRWSLPRQLTQRARERQATGETLLTIGAPDVEVAITLLTTGGPIIGTFLDGAYEQETIHLESGDLLVAYSDGVTEALNPADEEFREDRLRSILVESMQLTARELTEQIIASVKDWQRDAAQHDDITLVVAKVK